MGELRGRPDTPPDEPDKPAPATPDGARTPTPPTDSNADPRAIRDAFRRAEDPAFADTRVQTRYVTDRNPDTGPASLSPYQTSKDRPESEPKPERPDTPTARTLETDRNRAEKLQEGTDLREEDAPNKSTVDAFRKRVVENMDEVQDWTETLVNKIDHTLDRPTPTGQHSEARPRDSQTHVSPPHGLDAGTGASAMLATGLAIGELARRVYRKAAEAKEARDARIR